MAADDRCFVTIIKVRRTGVGWRYGTPPRGNCSRYRDIYTLQSLRVARAFQTTESRVLLQQYVWFNVAGLWHRRRETCSRQMPDKDASVCVKSVASLMGEGTAVRPGWHPPGGDTRTKQFFVGKFTKNSGRTRPDR